VHPNYQDMNNIMDDDPDDLAAAFFAQQAAKEAKKTALPVKDWIRVIEDNNTSNDTTEQAINAEKWLVTTLPNAKVDEANQGQGIVGIILNGNNCSLKKREIAMQDEDCNTEIIRDRIKQLLVQQIENNLQKKKLNER
jgi:hypothetical protein